MNRTRGTGAHWLAPVLALVMCVAAVGFLESGADAADHAPALQWSSARPDMVTGVDMAETAHAGERVVALSFDDGPDPRWTPAVLRLLDEHGAKATFFFTGEHVGMHPAIARDAAARGHELANHTYDHHDLPELDAVHVRDQVTRTNAAFRAAGLERPALFRPPRGRFDPEAAHAVRRAGLVTAGWTKGLCVEKVTRGVPPEEAAALLLSRVRPGAILLAHDGGEVDRSATIAALPHLLDGLRRAGYRMVTVSELLAMAGGVPRHR